MNSIFLHALVLFYDVSLLLLLLKNNTGYRLELCSPLFFTDSESSKRMLEISDKKICEHVSNRLQQRAENVTIDPKTEEKMLIHI